MHYLLVLGRDECSFRVKGDDDDILSYPTRIRANQNRKKWQDNGMDEMDKPMTVSIFNQYQRVAP